MDLALGILKYLEMRVSSKIEEVIKSKDYLFNVSISHNKTMAIAFVVLEDRQST